MLCLPNAGFLVIYALAVAIFALFSATLLVKSEFLMRYICKMFLYFSLHGCMIEVLAQSGLCTVQCSAVQVCAVNTDVWQASGTLWGCSIVIGHKIITSLPFKVAESKINEVPNVERIQGIMV